MTCAVKRDEMMHPHPTSDHHVDDAVHVDNVLQQDVCENVLPKESENFQLSGEGRSRSELRPEVANTASSVASDGFSSISSQEKLPVVLELCAGSAKLSSAFSLEGLVAIAIDYGGNRHETRHHVVHIDLRLEDSWCLFEDLLSMHTVVFCHMAPPCGTASRAREQRLSQDQWGPRPLRSSDHPWGLPYLREHDRTRVDHANQLYRMLASFCWILHARGIPFSIENPRRSYLWELEPYIDLQGIATFYDFSSCMHGGLRDKKTTFLSSLDLSPLCLECDGQHDHLPWGLQSDSSFATAAEAEYPWLLCQRISQLVVAHAKSLGFCLSAPFSEIRGKIRSDAAVYVQSRKAMPPLVSEFHYVVEVPATADPSMLDAKGCLVAAFGDAPQGAKRLKTVRKQVGESLVSVILFGVYRSPSEFIRVACSLDHPFDLLCDVPDCTIQVIFFMLTEGPVVLAKKRLQTLKLWRQWASDLESDEKLLHDNMEPGIRTILKGKRLKLLEKIAISFGWKDERIIKDIVTGFRLVGMQEASGLFPEEVNIPTMTEKQLECQYDLSRRVLLEKIAGSRFDKEVWDATMEETESKSWLEGPYSVEQLDERFNGCWMPVRRFGIQQSGKLRVIDDFTENGTNAAYGAQEKLDLRTLDHLVWSAATLAKYVWHFKHVELKLKSGEKLRGPLHAGWKVDKIKGIVSKTIDLKSAYKQLAIHPSDRKRAVVMVKDGSNDKPVGFVCSVLPFGAAAAVMAFNRVSRLLWRVLIEAKVLCGAYFDDYPLLDFGVSASSADGTAKAIFKLLGFMVSVDKDVEFSDTTTMLGVSLDTREAAGGVIKVANKTERVEALSKSIDDVVKNGKITSSEVPRTFGRLQFAEQQVAGRVGKLALAELRSLELQTNGVWYMNEMAINEMKLLKYRLCQHPPRKLSLVERRPPVVVFTDGACEPDAIDRYEASVGGVIFVRGEQPRFFGGKLHESLVERWMVDKKHIIGLVELYAIILARLLWARYIEGRKIIYFVDNMPAMRAVIKGSSKDVLWREVLAKFEELEMSGPSYPWLARVPSKSNIADDPSRGVEPDGMIKDVVKCLFSKEKIEW